MSKYFLLIAKPCSISLLSIIIIGCFLVLELYVYCVDTATSNVHTQPETQPNEYQPPLLVTAAFVFVLLWLPAAASSNAISTGLIF